MRNVKLVENELYHVMNRGVDKRSIFRDKNDLDRFFEGMQKLNVLTPTGHLARRLPESTDKKLVKFIAYDLNPNHFHFILEQAAERGIERLMNRLCISHSKYFNLKYHRMGTLFQGRFKAIHVDTNEYLLHLSAYVNLNDVAHTRNSKPGLSKSSWVEYIGESREEFCDKSIILDQFKNGGEYKRFAESTLRDIIDRKILLAELEDELMSIPGVDKAI
ncbi:MAG: transposase [bacterium]|nr:transposase [bacterium]